MSTLSAPAVLDASKLTITHSTVQCPVPALGSPEQWAQNVCSDHMVQCQWSVSGGWETPEIVPFGNLSLSPAASCLNYATQCFEGMKAYRGFDGKVRLFRPDCNARRLSSSAQRVCLPAVDDKELVALIKALLKIDAPRWLPKEEPGRFLYIRPSLIGTGSQMGVQLPTSALLYIITVPWPDFSKESPPGSPPRTGLRLLASQGDTIRAWPGGFGHAKVGANYGTSLGAHGEAQRKGFDQVLWLFGDDGRVTEAGASNFMAVVRSRETGRTELVTAPLTDKLILDGVTRRSVLELARKGVVGEVEVVERYFTMSELEEAWEEGRVVEAFVCGTAFFITPVLSINFKGRDLDMQHGDADPAKRIASILASWLGNIQYGVIDHEWGVVVEEEEEEEEEA
ncbi:branched-chain amino acid aminotransferase II [Aaosphaeria arxii CBS 175.79]|uniref:Branched-chain amino acid aminotransferase II n=1 Tax=Aaosphaeria arxii CBS 175.79 TaxID=1450172 RepID=A0A6A5XVY6_9PLEO|nr:branched-chain amino acid aminotransferase II [Aaosphaeria arxii CBS 175.79]KAF2016871.1 branched-chain amino acid aminotransferase II [Aaosphaeria arxii CBS 175.79]